jgi:hypothetical protein
MFLFDTDHLGILQHRTSPECQRILQQMQAYGDDDFYVSIVSLHEQVLGWNAYLSRARINQQTCGIAMISRGRERATRRGRLPNASAERVLWRLELGSFNHGLTTVVQPGTSSQGM